MTERGLAESLGLNKNYVNRRLRLLRLRPDLPTIPWYHHQPRWHITLPKMPAEWKTPAWLSRRTGTDNDAALFVNDEDRYRDDDAETAGAGADGGGPSAAGQQSSSQPAEVVVVGKKSKGTPAFADESDPRLLD